MRLARGMTARAERAKTNRGGQCRNSPTMAMGTKTRRRLKLRYLA